MIIGGDLVTEGPSRLTSVTRAGIGIPAAEALKEHGREAEVMAMSTGDEEPPIGVVLADGDGTIVEMGAAASRLVHQHDAVARIAFAALQSPSLREVLATTATTVADTLHLPYVVVLEVDGATTLTTRAAHGWGGSPPNAVWSLHYGTGEVLDRALDAAVPVVVPDMSREPSLTRHAALRGSREGSAIWMPIRRHGSRYGVLGVLTATRRAFRADEVAFVEGVARVITAAIERLEREERIRLQALHDPLTGLANRTLLQDRLQHALAARRRVGDRVGLLVLDLDRFKEVNDSLGHSVGDELLQHTARRLEAATRASDTCARLGGDEFAVVLTQVRDVGDVISAAHHVRVSLEEPLTVAHATVIAPSSIGIAIAPDHGQAPEDLLRSADIAMYDAKRTATGVAIFDRETSRQFATR